MEKSSSISRFPVEVVMMENLGENPVCLHGPTLKFTSQNGNFFACSSCRHARECTLRISEQEWKDERLKNKNKKYMDLIGKINHLEINNNFLKIKNVSINNRLYCVTCNKLCIIKCSKDHEIIKCLTDEKLSKPTTWLPPLANDKVEAQYFFSEKSCDVLVNIAIENQFRNILCIGTPRIYEMIKNKFSTEFHNSLLLDFDKRLHNFYKPTEFLWYNMFNHYFFGGEEAVNVFKEFLERARPDRLCIFLDPPFGGRVEPIVHTLRLISAQYFQSVCDELLPVIWVFPYFSEPYIVNMLPDVKMCDYVVEYENHKKFKSKQNKLSSPVRFFTNIPLNQITLLEKDGYSRCTICKKWVLKTNKHCLICKCCPSKNGSTYIHCDKCERCVKPTYIHCDNCHRCTQKKHDCGLVLPVKKCYHCHKIGQKSGACPQLKNMIAINITKQSLKRKKIK